VAHYHAVREKIGPRVRVGWIGTPSTDKYLRAILPAIDAAAHRTPVTLVTVGAKTITPKGKLVIEQHEWSEGTEADILASIDIGLMPIPDEPFERGKCGYKLIQYMASGCATIGSPVGVNREIIDDQTGILATTDEEWTAAIEALANDTQRRKSMGTHGRKKVEIEYSLEKNAQKLVALFNQTIESKRK
jgi:hypothetical protein